MTIMVDWALKPNYLSHTHTLTHSDSQTPDEKHLAAAQVWDMSDPTGRGYLEKPGFFVALKLIALVQSGQEMSISKLTAEAPQPNLVMPAVSCLSHAYVNCLNHCVWFYQGSCWIRIEWCV